MGRGCADATLVAVDIYLEVACTQSLQDWKNLFSSGITFESGRDGVTPVYKIHAKLNIGKEMVRKFEPLTFSERLSSLGHVQGAWYVNVQL